MLSIHPHAPLPKCAFAFPSHTPAITSPSIPFPKKLPRAPHFNYQRHIYSHTHTHRTKETINQPLPLQTLFTLSPPDKTHGTRFHHPTNRLPFPTLTLPPFSLLFSPSDTHPSCFLSPFSTYQTLPPPPMLPQYPWSGCTLPLPTATTKTAAAAAAQQGIFYPIMGPSPQF